ncbi:hypothetical protein [Mycobacterium shimoidei]|uniref:hypothetical protein n=1 Tax=Mycobacterium shimoidei TaxID=29313 RepID=UPI0015F0A605|nr:hypothetical protein [Mycobacterium shimoidei]
MAAIGATTNATTTTDPAQLPQRITSDERPFQQKRSGDSSIQSTTELATSSTRLVTGPKLETRPILAARTAGVAVLDR